MLYSNRKKIVIFEKNAFKEFESLPEDVRDKFSELIRFLEDNGKLAEPEAKKVTKELFELRVKLLGQWRSLYAYCEGDRIAILRFFRKKTQKTPLNDIWIATKRLKDIFT